jgi:hypothetical protein
MCSDGAKHTENISALYPHSSTELIAIVAGVLYASGFLIATAFSVRLGIQGSGIDFFKAKYIQTGILFFFFPAGVILPFLLRLYLFRASKAKPVWTRQSISQAFILVYIAIVLCILYTLTAFARVKFIFDNAGWILVFFVIVGLTISIDKLLDTLRPNWPVYCFWAVSSALTLFVGAHITAPLLTALINPSSGATLETGIYYVIWIFIAAIIVREIQPSILATEIPLPPQTKHATEVICASQENRTAPATFKPQDRPAASALSACLAAIMHDAAHFSGLSNDRAVAVRPARSV